MKILASDFDGTLSVRGRVSPGDLDAVRRFRKAGNLFGVITGRSFYDALGAVLEAGVPCDFLLAHSGATCFYNRRLLYTLRTDGSRIGEAARFILDSGGEFAGIQDGVGPHLLFTDPADERIAEQNGFTQMNTRFQTAEAAAQLAARLNDCFGDYLNALQNGNCIDIVRAGLNKGEGIRIFAREAGVAEKDVYTVGDNFNDLDMLTMFTGFAVSGACPEVKEKASGGTVSSVAEAIGVILG